MVDTTGDIRHSARVSMCKVHGFMPIDYKRLFSFAKESQKLYSKVLPCITFGFNRELIITLIQ